MKEGRIKCPNCSNQILAEAKKCRFCGEWFTEEKKPAVNSSPTTAQAPELKQELQPEPEEERMKCLYCSEQILADAKKCRFCGEWFGEKYKPSVNSDLITSEKVIFGDRSVPVETKGLGLEEYERLKNNILSLGSGKAIKTIMVSSSVAGEGCSTVAAHLARVLAKNSVFKVLLIDGNLRHPTLHKSFGLKNNMGLSDLTLSKAGINDVLKKTDFPNLLVMPSGKNNKIDPPQILESQKLKTLIEKLKDECNYLVFDSPPVSNYPDATILAPQMDGVILVVHAEKTRWEVAQRVKEQLEMANANILGVLLNKKKYVIPRFIYNRMK